MPRSSSGFQLRRPGATPPRCRGALVKATRQRAQPRGAEPVEASAGSERRLRSLEVVPPEQYAAEQAERCAEDRVADPPAPVRRRAVERLDLLRVDDPVDDYRLDGDAVSGPDHGCRDGVRPAIEDRGQESDAHDPNDERVPHVADDSTEHRDELEAAVEVVHAERDAPNALGRCPERLMNAVHRGGVLGNRSNHHLPRGHDEARRDCGDRTHLQDLRGCNARAARVPVDLTVGVGLHRNLSIRRVWSACVDAITEESAGSRALNTSRRSRDIATTTSAVLLLGTAVAGLGFGPALRASRRSDAERLGRTIDLCY